jgi:hypothetical protein
MKDIEFSITGFGFAAHSLNPDQKATIRSIAERLVSVDNAVPRLSATEMIEIIGHAKGTRNLAMHANERADSMINELKNCPRNTGASNAELAKVKRGEPVTKHSAAPAQGGRQGGKDRRTPQCGTAPLPTPLTTCRTFAPSATNA